MRLRSLAALLILLFASACRGLPVPRLVFDTPTPPFTPGPPPTPLPASIVTFRVRVPANTPPGSAPAVRLIDDVGGQQTTVILTDAGNNVWAGGTQAPVGAVLRYKYVRPLPALAEEVTAGGQEVPYRLLLVAGSSPGAEDVVAAWSDAAAAASTGHLAGRVWNSNTTRGVPGVLVAVGGKLALTAHDGSFVLYDLPAGPQRATLLAPDGSLRAAHQQAQVISGQTTDIDLVSDDPNAVHLTFLVRPPPGADARAALRMAGNAWQLGYTAVLQANGSAVAAARQPVLTPLADGRWTVTLLLYEGMHLTYKYTLGDGVWNGELDSAGSPRLRHLIVPPVDSLIDDTIVSWRRGNAPTITFVAQAPRDTPGTDLLSLQLRSGSWHPPLPMWRTDSDSWRFVLYNPTDFSGSVFYRYCRNYACGSADDSATAGPGATGRFFTPALFPQNLRDNISAWQWFGPRPGGAGSLPAVNPRPGFATGFVLAEHWQPNTMPLYAQAFGEMRSAGASWVTFTRRGLVERMQPPALVDDAGLAPLHQDWAQLVSTAHNVGLRVAMHPVTCAYTPYGACDYWSGASFGGSFWNDWFAAYERYLLSQAELARQTGTDLLVIGDFKLRPALPGEPEAPADAEARWRALITRVRAVYAGPLAFELLMGDAVWPTPPPFLDALDVVRVWWWSPLAAGSNPDVGSMAVTAGSLMDGQLLPLQQQLGKPLHLSAAYLSASGAASQCLRRPDGACHRFEDFGPGSPDVIAHGLSLSEQADAYHAVLLAVNDRPWISGFFSYGYNPAAALRDKSVSVRGKPAEAVLAAWFLRLQNP
jgi:hypothetical protein